MIALGFWFDLHTDAELIATLPQVPDKQVLNAYLKTYLQLLHSTGRLVLLSLPDMDRDGMRTPIDFSAIATVSRLDGIDKVLGVSVEDINDFLNSRWLHLAMSVGFAKVNAAKSVASLIECRSTWQSSKTDAHFVVNFGAPRVAALCSREAVIFLSLEDVIFYQSEDLTGSVSLLSFSFMTLTSFSVLLAGLTMIGRWLF